MEKILHFYYGNKEKNSSFLLLLIPILFFLLTMIVLYSFYKEGKLPLLPKDKTVLGTAIPLSN